MLRPVVLSPEDIANPMMANTWAEQLERLTPEQVNAWLFFIDPLYQRFGALPDADEDDEPRRARNRRPGFR